MSRAAATSTGAGDAAVPAGFRAAPLWPGEDAASVRVCVLVGEHGAGARLVNLRETVDGRALLGCLVDRAGRVHEWLEIWVQDTGGIQQTPAVFRDAVSNAALDNRWKDAAKALRSPECGGVFATVWESEHPGPVVLDGKTLAPVVSALKLCRDESLLAKWGLPSYGTSTHRYLYDPAGGDEGQAIAATPEAPMSDRVRPSSEAFPGDAVAVNPGAGLMLVRPRAPVSYENVIDALGADPATAALRTGPLPDGDAALQLLGEAGFLSSPKGPYARAIEAVHLKLRRLTGAAAAVRALVSQTQRPLLNLTADSFRVRLGVPGEGLPLLWTARAVLTDAGDAAALPIPGADAEYYIRPGSAASVYAPESAGRAVQGRASLRVRKVEASGGGVVVMGTFSTQERLKPSPSDLTWVRLQASGERIDLYARLEQEPGLAPGEWRFRSVPQRFGEAARKGLQAAEGVVTSEAPFQVVPLLSTPCDLYALAVLGVRTLLVGDGNTLGEAVDELFSLARNAAGEKGENGGARGAPG